MTDTGPEYVPADAVEVVPHRPWHQLSTETEPAYSHFRAYLNQERGRRSIRRLADELGMNVSTLSDLSARHQWVARVQAHDFHIDAIEEQEFEAERRRIARDAARAAGTAVQAATLALRAGVLGLQDYGRAAVGVNADGVAVDADGRAVQRLDADQALAAIRVGIRAAVGGHQLVADKVRPGDLPDALPIEEVAHGLDVFDLAAALWQLTGQAPVEPAAVEHPTEY